MLLLLIIRDYIDAAQPVGSRRLVERFRLDLSSATIRNEMAALTDLGYLRQPHTSAGRVPTEEGYRFFVGRMMYRAELPQSVRKAIVTQFHEARADMDQWMHLAASVLAHRSQGASVVTAPRSVIARFRHIELVSTQGRQVLMVLVLAGGEVSQQVLTLAAAVSQDRLSQTASHINGLFSGLSPDELASAAARADALERDILLLVSADMRRFTDSSAGEIYTDGLTNVLAEPEFAGSDDARHALKILEERSVLRDVLSRTSNEDPAGGLQVLIGGEGEWQELRQCSMILARYGVPGIVTGTLGVLGPMRMPYSRTIPMVRFVARLLSGFVNDRIGAP